MRVLHLPVNIASIPSHTVRGLRQIGVDARGLLFSNNSLQSSDGMKVIGPVSRRKPHLWIWRKFIRSHSYYYQKLIAWADIIHWYYGDLPHEIDLRYVKTLNKPAVVEWLGSDIRIPEIEFADNPYYKTAFHNGYEYQSESLERSRQTQKKFAEVGFASIVSVGMLRYVQTDICSRVYIVPQRIVLSDYRPSYPNPNVVRPIVIHSPTAPIAKGTSVVVKVIEQLKMKYNFKFRLIQGMPRSEAIQMMQSADIFLDQFVLGDHGMAALEAMAFGKPILCYIKPSMIDKYTPDCPIINANQNNLTKVLEPLLKDGRLRYEIGQRGREYVEKYHNATKVGHQLVAIYRKLIEDRRHCRC